MFFVGIIIWQSFAFAKYGFSFARDFISCECWQKGRKKIRNDKLCNRINSSELLYRVRRAKLLFYWQGGLVEDF